jgi:hypothetical protein
LAVSEWHLASARKCAAKIREDLARVCHTWRRAGGAAGGGGGRSADGPPQRAGDETGGRHDEICRGISVGSGKEAARLSEGVGVLLGGRSQGRPSVRDGGAGEGHHRYAGGDGGESWCWCHRQCPKQRDT